MIEPKRIDFIDSEGILLYENVVSNDQLFDWFNKMNSHAYFRQCASSEKTTDGKVIEQAKAWQANFNKPDVIEQINADPNISSKISDVDNQSPLGFDLMEEIWNTINDQCGFHHLEPIQQYINAFNHGDNTWGHTDLYDYTIIVYINPEWDNQIMGGETLFFDDDYQFIRCAVACTPGNVVCFKGQIPHKGGLVSRDTTVARYSVVFQCKEFGSETGLEGK